MIKYLFRNNDNQVPKVKLRLPSPHAYKALRDRNRYENKEFFWNKIRPVVQFLSKCESVEWDGDPLLYGIATHATEELLARKGTSAKDTMVDFYFLFFSNQANTHAMLDGMITERGFELAKMLVDKGAICLDTLPHEMGWPPYKANHWNDNIDKATLERWRESIDTAPLSTVSMTAQGPSEMKKSSTYSYSRPYPFIIPGGILIGYVAGKLVPSLVMTANPEDDDKSLVKFSGTDFLAAAGAVQNLIISGVVTPSKTKIGVNTVKRINSYIEFEQFPKEAHTIMSRGEYIANLTFMVFGEPGSFSIPKKAFPVEEYLRLVYDNTAVKCKYFFNLILAESVRGMAFEFYFLNKHKIQTLHTSIVEVLKSSVGIAPDCWCSYDSFVWRVACHMSMRGMGYIFPTSYNEKPESVRDTNEGIIPMSDFKKCFNDVIIRGMVESLAAIGAVDIYYGTDGGIKYIKLTEGGKWYMGLIEKRPVTEDIATAENSIDIDDETGLVVITNPKYPYVSLIPDFADKLTDTRYHISEKSFLSGCHSQPDLEEKVKRFRSFILPSPGPRMSAMIESLNDRCNLVKRTVGGSTYTLYDVSPNNPKLHDIIMDDPEIRMNILRVEGCRLLVKTKYLDTFFLKLAEAGYLNDTK